MRTPRVVSSLAALLVASSLAGACKSEDKDSSDEPTTAERPDGEDPGRAIAPDSVEALPDGDFALSNLPQMIERLGLAPYHAKGHRGQGLTIAVLDNGFAGLNQSLGKRLPPDVHVEEAARPDMQRTTHGTKLAEIAYALATGSTQYSADRPGPTMLLYNTNGFSNFRDAAAKVAARGVDMVLYAQIWEYGGNGDGAGFINREIDPALDRGILWVNAAGNLGQSTYSGPLTIAADTGSSAPEVKLPFNDRYVRLVVPQNGTPVKVVLAWNDFDESKDYRTPQDLDLILEDGQGQEIGAGRLVQSGDVDIDAADYSAHAREIVNTVLNAGIYRLRVEARSNNFDPSSRLRISADGVGVRFMDRGESEQVVMMPADNPRVLTIGASDVQTTSRDSAPGAKPELDVVSEVVFEDGTRRQGTSAATAIAVGALAVYQSAYGKMNRSEMVREIIRGSIAIPAERCVEGATTCVTTPVLKLTEPR